MAEQLEGSFAMTVLDGADNLWIVKGDNLLCLLDFPRLGVYLYASTEEILRRALDKLWLRQEKQVHVPADCGELLRLFPDGTISRSTFDDKNLFLPWYGGFYDAAPFPKRGGRGASWDASPWDAEYLEEIKDVASAFGYAPEAIDTLLKQGFSPEDVEDFLYCGEL